MKVVFKNIHTEATDSPQLSWHDYMIDNFTHNKIYNAKQYDDDMYNVGMLLDSDNGEKYIGSKYYELYFEPLRDVNLSLIE